MAHWKIFVMDKKTNVAKHVLCRKGIIAIMQQTNKQLIFSFKKKCMNQLSILEDDFLDTWI